MSSQDDYRKDSWSSVAANQPLIAWNTMESTVHKTLRALALQHFAQCMHDVMVMKRVRGSMQSGYKPQSLYGCCRNVHAEMYSSTCTHVIKLVDCRILQL